VAATEAIELYGRDLAALQPLVDKLAFFCGELVRLAAAFNSGLKYVLHITLPILRPDGDGRPRNRDRRDTLRHFELFSRSPSERRGRALAQSCQEPPRVPLRRPNAGWAVN